MKEYGQMDTDRNKHIRKYWMEKKLSAELQRWIWWVEQIVRTIVIKDKWHAWIHKQQFLFAVQIKGLYCYM